MINNYEYDENGVIYQKDRIPFIYDKNYVTVRYDTYNQLNVAMSHLRLGYIIGVLGHIPTSILDVGYGNGAFLKACCDIIPRCLGHDISGYEIPTKCEFVADIFKAKVEVMTFFDSLEHFQNPYFMKNLDCKYVCISLPWCHNFSDEWFENWKHRRPNEHLWHFNDKSLSAFMVSQGYKVRNICDIEDTIRQSTFDYSNILTGIFEKC